MDMGITTQEDKELLLIDLCARLCYHTCVLVDYVDEYNVHEVLNAHHIIGLKHYTGDDGLINIKPYLRPMSSMTEEEEKELKKIHHQFYKGNFIDAGVFSANDCGCTVFEMSNILNYLRSRNFDYCGMIDRGLALEAPEGMYK